MSLELHIITTAQTAMEGGDNGQFITLVLEVFLFVGKTTLGIFIELAGTFS